MDTAVVSSAGSVVDKILRELVGGSLTLSAAPVHNSTELVGIADGGTIGLVVANADRLLAENLGLDENARTLGIVGAKSGSHSHVLAADEAVKGSGAKLLLARFPIDSDGLGSGCLLIFGAETVAEVRRAVEICLKDVTRTTGERHTCPAGGISVQFSAHTGGACRVVYGVAEGTSLGIVNAMPAVLGIYLADVAVKSAAVTPVRFALPGENYYSNESTLLFTGESSAVKNAVCAAREAGKALLEKMCGAAPVPAGESYV